MLKKHHLEPIAIAVDLSRSTDTILRDVKGIINAKRASLGIVEADRRIKLNSFAKIRDLDLEVCEPDGPPPFLSTVNQFERSAKLDLSDLICLIEHHADGEKPSDQEEDADRIIAVASMLADGAPVSFGSDSAVEFVRKLCQLIGNHSISEDLAVPNLNEQQASEVVDQVFELFDIFRNERRDSHLTKVWWMRHSRAPGSWWRLTCASSRGRRKRCRLMRVVILPGASSSS